MTWPANRILRALLENRHPVESRDLAATTGLAPSQVWDATVTLVKNGLVKQPRPGCMVITAAGRSAVSEGLEIRPGGKEGPRPQSKGRQPLRTRIWSALRVQTKGTLGEFIALVLQPDEDEHKATDNANKYLRGLHQAGYLSVLPGRIPGTAPSSPGYLRYLLVENTGPLAPVVRKSAKQLYDPNLKKTVPFKEVL